MVKAMTASAEVAERVAADINIEWDYGSDSLAQHWTQLLNNQIAPSRGLMVAL
jgi:carbonic anhydrase